MHVVVDVNVVLRNPPSSKPPARCGGFPGLPWFACLVVANATLVSMVEIAVYCFLLCMIDAEYDNGLLQMGTMGLSVCVSSDFIVGLSS